MKFVAMLFSLALGAIAQTIPADPDDIAGIVTSDKGPEAGVWVIAETTGLPTKFAKIVVTDDRGRYLLPDLPKANYSVWVRGYGLVDSAESASDSGQDAEPQGRRRPRRARRGAILPGQLLVFAAPRPREKRIPRHRPAGQRHLAQHEEPGRIPRAHQDR